MNEPTLVDLITKLGELQRERTNVALELADLAEELQESDARHYGTKDRIADTFRRGPDRTVWRDGREVRALGEILYDRECEHERAPMYEHLIALAERWGPLRIKRQEVKAMLGRYDREITSLKREIDRQSKLKRNQKPTPPDPQAELGF